MLASGHLPGTRHRVRWASLAFGLLACGPGPGGAVAGPSAQSSHAAATVAAPHEPPRCPKARTLDVAAISAEIACWLARYVQVDTTNPPGNELAAARFLQAVLAEDGISAQILESAPGRANLIARLPGRARGEALMWVHHMDVVPAQAEQWTLPPLSGTVREGYLWGRGSLDNKGGGIVQLVAFMLLSRLGIVPERDVILLAVADEEAGGALGARWITEQHPELLEGVGFVLNEGGAILELGGGRVVYAVELAQKAPLWLRVTARGPAGHGGAPLPSSAASVLVRALARLGAHRFPIRVLPEVQAMFSARAEAMPAGLAPRYRDLEASLADPAFREQFMRDPRDAALVQTTLAITMLEGSPKENVISAQASAVLDVRLLPGQDPEPVHREIEAVLAEPTLELTPILLFRAHASPRDTPLFHAIERLAQLRDGGAPVTANVIGGFTDCSAFRAKGLVCYGFLPARLAPAELGGIHGNDERVELATLAQAVIDLHEVLRQLGPASSHAAPPALSAAPP